MPTVVPGAVLLAGLLIWWANPAPIEEAQYQAFDLLLRLHPRTYRDAPVRIVDIDDETLAKYGQWPWPRTQIAELVTKLNDLGVAVAAFDAVFSEPDRTSPLQVLPLWPPDPETDALREHVDKLPDHDQVLAQTIRGAHVVTGFAFTKQAIGRAPALKASFAFSGDQPQEYVPQLPGTVLSLPILEEAAAGNGHFNQWPDQDGIIRRVPLLMRYRDNLYPSLVMEALRVAQGASAYKVKTSGGSGAMNFGARTGIVKVQIGRLVVPTDGQGRVWLYDTGPVERRTLPAWRVLSGEVEPGALDGAIVYIGTSAAGLKDLRATPLNPVAAGVELHAQLTEQMLLGEYLQRPDWARGAEGLYMLLLGLLLILLLPRLGPVWCACLGVLAIAGVCLFSWLMFLRHAFLIDPVWPSLLTLAIYIVASSIGFLRAELQRRQVRHAFSRYLSPALVARLAERPEQLTLGGENRNMTILFTDIQGFTGIAEQLDAQALTKFMNRFLTPMTRLILECAGTIDKYIGDCIMAFWNAPLDDPQHAAHACQAALAMRDHLVVLNKAIAEEATIEGRPPITVHIGIGINTGVCSVGNFGSEQRFDYSVIGDSVNLASRLEGQTRTYGVDVILGETTYEQAGEHAVLELDLIRVKGKSRPARIFGLLGDHALKLSERFRTLTLHHQAMLAAYRAQRWTEAKELMSDCLAMDTDRTRLRKLYALYEQRINTFQISSPGPQWDGVYVATSK